jgi:hypothetical protein
MAAGWKEGEIKIPRLLPQASGKEEGKVLQVHLRVVSLWSDELFIAWT